MSASRRRSRVEFGSVSDVISATSQVVLIGLAVYGLFISDAGDRLLESLNGDVREARENLTRLQGERSSLDRDLDTQRSQLLSNQIALLKAEGQLETTQSQRDNAVRLLDETARTLAGERQQIGLLAKQVALTIPARRQVICDGLSLRIGFLPQSIDLDGLLPRFRWLEFRRQASKTDLASWKSLDDAFQSWSSKSLPASAGETTFKRIILKSADDLVELKLSIPAHWEKMGKEAAFMLAGQGRPESFDMPFEPLGRKAGTLASVARMNPWNSIAPLVAPDNLSALDKDYDAWLTRLRSNVERQKVQFDYDFPTYIPLQASYSDMEGEAVRYLRLIDGVDEIYASMKPVCSDYEDKIF